MSIDNNNDDYSDSEPYFDESFFIDKNYVLQQQTFTGKNATQSYTVEYYALKNVVTSYELTGQLIWPATHILALYLLYNVNNTISQYNNIIEFGSGTGIISLLLGKICQQHHSSNNLNIYATDHNKHVLDLINQNIQYNSLSNIVQSYMLEWNNNEHANQLINDILHDSNGDHNDSTLLIGSDLCYSVVAVEALVNSVYNILTYLHTNRTPKNPIFILSYILRTQTVHDTLHDSIKQHNMICESIDLTTFMTIDKIPANGYLYIISLNHDTNTTM